MGTRLGISIGIGAQTLVKGVPVTTGGFSDGFSDGYN